MKNLTTTVLFATFLSSISFAGQVTLYCNSSVGSLEACADKAESVIDSYGCEVLPSETECQLGGKRPSCVIKSNKCNYAFEQLFIPWTTCHDDKKVKIPKKTGLSNFTGGTQAICVSK